MTEAGLREHWNSLSRGSRRIAIALAISLDACSGLLFEFGSLNIIDAILFGSLPTDLIWLLQTLQLICVGFVVVKVFFDDLPDSTIRTILIITSPLLLIVYVLRGRTNKDKARLFNCGSKVTVLGEKTVTRVDSVGAR